MGGPISAWGHSLGHSQTCISTSTFDREGDRLAAHVTTTGTLRGPLNGIPPTGKSFKATATDIFRFNAEGKIAVDWGVFEYYGRCSEPNH
jgi:hypothetical protein